MTVIKGIGQLKSAVAELRPTPSSNILLFGTIRLSQMKDGSCFVDGLVDLTSQDKLGLGIVGQRILLAIHEFGDLSSETYDSIGTPPIEILELEVKEDSVPISIQKFLAHCNVTEQIGRSIALSFTDKDEQNILTAGVIARASTIQSNKKQVCSCSGKTLWEERVERQKGNFK